MPITVILQWSIIGGDGIYHQLAGVILVDSCIRGWFSSNNVLRKQLRNNYIKEKILVSIKQFLNHV